ncbi:MAG TPA: hypothetical protein VGS06_34055 [Streptosporangiaceae bacterium]|nr:hypothetical protein [Streptosporangiaceae bacterium]
MRDCHSDPARPAASWVFPDDPGTSGLLAAAWAETSATAVPGTSAASRPGTVSGRATKPSASGGTRPARTGHVRAPAWLLADPAGWAWPSAGVNP